MDPSYFLIWAATNLSLCLPVLPSYCVTSSRSVPFRACPNQYVDHSYSKVMSQWEHSFSWVRIPPPKKYTLDQILHDFQHGGVSNDFLVQSSDPLALLYNDRSPMENHHVSAGSRLMALPVGHRVEDEVES
jgi:hypothetical protein